MRFIPFFILILLVNQSCLDERLPSLNGENSGLYGVIDTFNVFGNTINDDGYSISAMSISPIGVVNEPTLGKTTSNLYTNFELPINDLNLGNPILDSVVFSMAYNGVFGNNTQPIDIEVFELDTKIERKSYLSSDVFYAKSGVIGKVQNFIPNYTDSVFVLNRKEAPQLRIRLSDNFGQKIIDQSGKEPLKNNANFQDFIKGLYVSANSNANGNGFSYFSLYHPQSRLTVYYQKGTEHFSVEFPIGTSSNFINQYFHERAGSAATINTGAVNGDELLYLQGMEGTKVKINLGDLTSLKDIPVVKAELILTVEDGVYNLPSKLFIDRMDSSGKRVNLLDYDVSKDIFSGRLSSNQVGGKTVYQYKFDITKHVHTMKSGAVKDNIVYLYAGDLLGINVSQNIYSCLYKGDRIVLGGNKTSSKMRMRITYFK